MAGGHHVSNGLVFKVVETRSRAPRLIFGTYRALQFAGTFQQKTNFYSTPILKLKYLYLQLLISSKSHAHCFLLPSLFLGVCILLIFNHFDSPMQPKMPAHITRPSAFSPTPNISRVCLFPYNF